MDQRTPEAFWAERSFTREVAIRCRQISTGSILRFADPGPAEPICGRSRLSMKHVGHVADGGPTDAADMLKAAQEPRLTYYPVPNAVGSPKNDLPDLVVSIER